MAKEDRSRDEIADVLIIGAGASGSVAAKHLAEAGFKVVCLEQGRKIDPGEFTGDKPEWELTAQRDWHPNPNVRDLEEDYPIETSDSDVNPLMFNGVGGSTILYAAHWQRFKPSDFHVKTLDGIAEDWPFSYADLLPYYEALDIEMGVSGLGGDPAYPPGKAPPLPPLPINKAGRKAAEGMNKLGWHWWPSPNNIPSRAYNGRNPCVRRGTCLTGCPEGAKGSTDLTHWPAALKAGARLVTGARVSQIETDGNGLATGAVYFDRAGRERRQRASVVIVCGNAVGTARLLLLSGKGSNSALANSSGLVGTHLMMHPYAAVNGLFDEPLESWIGPSGQMIHSLEFVESDPSRGFLRGGKWQVMPSGGPLGLRAGYTGKAIEDHWGLNLHRSTKQTFGRSFEWGITAEDLPDIANRVVLDEALTDSDGIPSPKIIYKNSDNTRKLLDFHVARAREAMGAAGATDITSTSLMRDCGWHLMGTARMGHDPETSVVDQWCRSHDVPNLYVMDGSTFVTSSASNPTATITAIAFRAVSHLIAHRREQEIAA
ncbi:GMC family oxidoreductase [Sphingomonas abietis]|uniref:GMC family oxidoreductase n=1 Tax=Sphingomonas abietis TaxID=3012344 RepID=A0ABY7NKA4_9SPHN|nr:GMC family oxidoreductase [Sphingomonas abietis]WBO21970.1 GMC family oxidoreductase [Sphingomonas abietis]